MMKKLFKKICVVSMIAVMGLCLSSCGEKENNKVPLGGLTEEGTTEGKVEVNTTSYDYYKGFINENSDMLVNLYYNQQVLGIAEDIFTAWPTLDSVINVSLIDGEVQKYSVGVTGPSDTEQDIYAMYLPYAFNGDLTDEDKLAEVNAYLDALANLGFEDQAVESSDGVATYTVHSLYYGGYCGGAIYVPTEFSYEFDVIAYITVDGINAIVEDSGEPSTTIKDSVEGMEPQ